MQIRQIVLREVRMSLVAPFETSFGRTTERRILLLQAEVDSATGWGEVVASETPFYHPETLETAWHILRDFIWAMLKGQEFSRAAEVWGLLTRIRGHNMAKGGL
jgi:O-succinylbenzoate synthase